MHLFKLVTIFISLLVVFICFNYNVFPVFVVHFNFIKETYLFQIMAISGLDVYSGHRWFPSCWDGTCCEVEA